MSQNTEKKSFPALYRLGQEFRPYKGLIATVLLLGLIISAIQPVAVKMSQKIIDELQKVSDQGFDLGFFRWVTLSLVGLFLISGFAKYGYGTLRRYVGEKVILRLRSALFRKYISLPLSEIDQLRTGDMLAQIQNDLNQINQGIDTVCDVLKEPFTFLGLIAVAFYNDWRLTLCTLVVAPLVAYVFGRSGKAVKRYSAKNLDQFSDLMSLSQEAITGARVVKVFRLENPLIEKFSQIQDQYFKTAWKSIKVQELGTPIVEFIGAILMASVVLYGGYRAQSGALTAGELVGFVIALGLAQMPLKKLNLSYMKLKNAEAAADRLYQMLDRPEVFQVGKLRSLSTFEKSIRYEDVSLNYGDKLVLSDINFEVLRGEPVAFVGHSGGGKTSVVNLLPRLYEVSRGRILIDGIDIRTVDVSELRKLMSVVTQDVFLFNDTLYENIRLGRPEASSQEVERAAEQAHCLDFIRRFPEGFHAKIGDRGVRLSGGERQRLAIARALLKGAPILILDEATSNLDSRSESIVQEALDELMKNRTSLVVAHRLSTVRQAKKIFVVESGRIHETGSHDELVKSPGLYADLFERQLL